jgi:hypothetical protein
MVGPGSSRFMAGVMDTAETAEVMRRVEKIFVNILMD